MKGIKEKSLRLIEAMNLYNKKFEKGVLNLLNAPPACGKTTFITKDFLNNTTKYIKGINNNNNFNYNKRLSKVLYVCDTTMLRDSVLSESNNIITKFGKGSFIDANNFNDLTKILSEDNGQIKIMTYSTLGWCIKNCKKLLLDSFNIIIADEIQNLFKYCQKYNIEMNEEGKKVFSNGEYVSVIENLQDIATKTLLIGLSGTINSIYNFQDQYGEFVKLKKVFTEEERKTLFTNNFEPMHTNCIFNRIKTIDYNKVKERDCKIFIYTRTIAQSKKYKEWFELNGLKAEWLCSINNKTKLESTDNEGNTIVEEIPTMNEYQLSIRDRLLYGTDEEGNNKGTVPDDLDILIVNGGYETGWNLIDERFQLCFCDTTNYEEQVQARNRIRHDILSLWCLQKLYNEDGVILDYNQYGELFEREEWIGSSTYRYVYVYEFKMNKLDEKYIGIKLDKKLKEEIKFIYGIKGLNDKKVTWTTVKRDLEMQGYTVKTFKGKNNGTYIFKEGQEIKKDSKKEVKKVNKLIEFLIKYEGKKLTEKQKTKLIELVNSRNAKGELHKTISKIQKQLDIYEVGFTVLSKSSNGLRWWQIESIAE